MSEAELIGGWKVLNWLRHEFTENMTVEDIVETVKYMLELLSIELWNKFNTEHGVIMHLDNQTEKRLKNRVIAK